MKTNILQAKKALLVLFALLPLVASAEKVEINGIWYNLVSKAKQAEVTFKGDSWSSYSGEYSGDITIPATITYEGAEYSVTSIGEQAFYGCYPHSISLPESVTSIGNSAFFYCQNLTSVTIPENSQLTSIGTYAFYRCRGLTSIAIPVNSQLISIGESAFKDCEKLTSITIPESVTSIGSYAFSDCTSLTTVHISNLEAWCNISFGFAPLSGALYLNAELITELVIPAGVTSIRESAFSGCSGLTSVTIPESVTSIGVSAFWGCSGLQSITIPECVTSIGGNAFWGCSSLTSINIPDGVTRIGSQAFQRCSSLASINIPDGVTEIGYGTFWGCSSLTSITIPESVTSIGEQAFYDCSGLTTIVLPKSVEYIRSKAFANCFELTDVYCYAESVPSTDANAFDGSFPEYATLHVPVGAINSYKATAPWSSFGKFETTSIAVERITLSQSSATLTEGETLVLTATVTPDDAADKSISWSSSNPSVATVDNTGKVTAIAKGTATITAMAKDGSGASASCEIVVNELILGECATPTINYKDGKVVFACDTEGAIVKSDFIENIAGSYNDMEVAFIPTYTLTAYATKEKYADSDEVTLTICWVPCDKNHEGGTTDILTIPAKPVLISTQGGTITVSGLAAGTAVAAYSTASTELATATATDGTATLATELEAGSIAIVKIGDYSIKVAIK